VYRTTRSRITIAPSQRYAPVAFPRPSYAPLHYADTLTSRRICKCFICAPGTQTALRFGIGMPGFGSLLNIFPNSVGGGENENTLECYSFWVLQVCKLTAVWKSYSLQIGLVCCIVQYEKKPSNVPADANGSWLLMVFFHLRPVTFTPVPIEYSLAQSCGSLRAGAVEAQRTSLLRCDGPFATLHHVASLRSGVSVYD
jgi:hypothetical protein